jgi:hypothetical protein
VSSGAASGTKISASDAAILDNSESHPKLSSRQKDAPELLDDNVRFIVDLTSLLVILTVHAF